MTITFTPEQEAILDFARSSTQSLVVNALAGASKTTTLVAIAQALVESGQTQILALAFNSRIKEEMSRRLPSQVTCLTLNGLGHRAWMKSLPGKRIELETGKGYAILKEQSAFLGIPLEPDEFKKMLELVASAKCVGLVPKSAPGCPIRLVPDTEDSWVRLCVECELDWTPRVTELATACLIKSIEQAYQGIIDFDDQLYMSVCYNATYPKFPIVLVDEAQDLSPMNHRQVVKVVGGRVIIVGDRHQSIYAFRGADPTSIDKLSELFKCHELELTTTFRCDEAICNVVRKHVPSIKHRDGAGKGLVRTLERYSIMDLVPGSAILCRNNAPLLQLASKCLRAGIGVQVLGKDIGKSLQKILTKWPDSTPAPTLITSITTWAASEIQKATAKKNFAKVHKVEDQAECLLGILESNPCTCRELKALLESLFNNPGAMLTFATGHKSKGLEFPVVYHLDPWRVPSRRVVEGGDPAQLIQERNLQYVINTRAKHELTFLNLKGCIEIMADEEELEIKFTPEQITNEGEYSDNITNPDTLMEAS